ASSRCTRGSLRSESQLTRSSRSSTTSTRLAWLTLARVASGLVRALPAGHLLELPADDGAGHTHHADRAVGLVGAAPGAYPAVALAVAFRAGAAGAAGGGQQLRLVPARDGSSAVGGVRADAHRRGRLPERLGRRRGALVRQLHPDLRRAGGDRDQALAHVRAARAAGPEGSRG